MHEPPILRSLAVYAAKDDGLDVAAGVTPYSFAAFGGPEYGPL